MSFKSFHVYLYGMEDLQALFIILFTSGAVILLAGIVLLIFPPKKMNHIYGYRTKKSMHSEENWEFAQTYSAKLMIGLGAAFVLLSFASIWFDLSDTFSAILALLIVIGGTILMFVKTERELSKKMRKKNDEVN